MQSVAACRVLARRNDVTTATTSLNAVRNVAHSTARLVVAVTEPAHSLSSLSVDLPRYHLECLRRRRSERFIELEKNEIAKYV